MDEEAPATAKTSKISRTSVKRRRLSTVTEPTLCDMAPLLSQTVELARPPVKEFLKHGLDAPIAKQGATRGGTATTTATSNATFGSPQGTGVEEDENAIEKRQQLKRQLELFLLPEHPLLSSALLRQPAISKENEQRPWMIHPYGKFRARWDMTMVLLVVSNVVLIPVQATYFSSVEDEIFQWMFFSLVSDAVFAADIAFNFRTGVIVEQDYERVVMDPGYVARSYLRGFFLIDLVSTLPWDYLLALMLTLFSHEADEGDASFAITVRLLHLTKFLKLLKLLRLTRLVRYLDNVEQNYFFYSSGVYLRLTNYIGLLLLIGHWNACLQFFVPRMQGFPPDSWVAKQDLVRKPWFEQYSWSVYNAISQMVSCGYGRTPAANVADAWLMCLGMASGTVGYALLLGLCASTIQTMDYSRRLLREKLKEVEDYMQCQKFPTKLRSRMRDYFENRYEGRVFDEAKILASLSEPLREEIVNHSIRTTVRTVPFFAQSEPTFVAELVSRLRHEFFQPGDLIVKQDTVGHKMYFLQSGKVNIVHDNGEFVASAYAGAYFGEMCLLTRARRQANVVAETYCNALSLSDEDFQRALDKHPLMRRALEALCAEQGAQLNPAAKSQPSPM
ncbi:potassium/sodium hyperpolarization-activated cyclic nucleotide-gated channel 1-like [Dermacentor albipictus]|uniref:potassium/sodium hyperpolarization-activated cyclic nucleotide-gated channel 1-like n=1 Tax=Dermacentor albipictus TaxID=60249 RepID=UPI0031FDCBF8